jgi:hypothetical protein
VVALTSSRMRSVGKMRLNSTSAAFLGGSPELTGAQ